MVCMDVERRIVIRVPELNRRLVFWGVGIALAVAGFSYWYGWVRPYVRIGSAHFEAYVSVVGTDVAGRIVEVGPQEGEAVKKGETLFSLDRDLMLAKQSQMKLILESLNDQVEAEKGQIGKAMEAYLTASVELEAGAGSPEQIKRHLALIDEAQEKIEATQGKIAITKAEMGILDLQLKKMTCAAPFDGVILKRSKNPGAVVSFGEPIYVLCDLERSWVEAEVAEIELGWLKVGTEARVRFAAYPGREFTGRVSYIGSATVDKSAFTPIVAQGQVVPIRITIDQTDAVLRPGLSATVRLVYK